MLFGFFWFLASLLKKYISIGKSGVQWHREASVPSVVQHPAGGMETNITTAKTVNTTLHSQSMLN